MVNLVGVSDETPPAEPKAQGPKTPGAGEGVERIGTRFAVEEAVGVLLLDASSFSEIERLYGFEAHRQAMSRLAALVREVVLGQLDAKDIALWQERGRSEIVLLLFRPANDTRFYTEEVSALRRAISEGIARQGNRVAYPYAKRAPAVHVGMNDMEWQMDALFVCKRPFAVETMSACHFTVIGGVNNDSVLSQTESVQFGQDTADLKINTRNQISVMSCPLFTCDFNWSMQHRR